mmetsp:Transcript_31726/g.28102  ORF Transcript_31726/g.28102 Transcript_31726/m.28102 type:complete len:127 (+) Transcript_31726:3-383(+)
MFRQDMRDPSSFEEILDFHAHSKSSGPQDPQFGSLNKYSEVWSLVFQDTDDGREGKYFVTCSEDQTCKVWKLKKRRSRQRKLSTKSYATLKGHTRAITDIAWFKMDPEVLGEENNHLELFASCSDD